MSRISPLLLLLASVAALPACSFSEGGDYDCAEGASVTATVDGRAFTAECVEVSANGDGLTVAAFANPDGESSTVPYTQIRFILDDRATGTYAIGASGPAELLFATQPIGGGDQGGDGTDGAVVVTESTDARVRGTFAATVALEEDFSPTGETVAITNGSFSVSL